MNTFGTTQILKNTTLIFRPILILFLCFFVIQIAESQEVRYYSFHKNDPKKSSIRQFLKNKNGLVRVLSDTSALFYNQEFQDGNSILIKSNNFAGEETPFANYFFVSANKELTVNWLKSNQIEFELNHGVFRIATTEASTINLIRRAELMFLELEERPILETVLPTSDLSVNAIDWLGITTGVNGREKNIGLKENRFDTTDLDLLGKLVITDLVPENADTHASAMATLIGGRGNSANSGRGVLPDIGIQSSSFENILPDDDGFLESLTVQNHSYGFNINNEYDLLARAYDASIRSRNKTLHVFSSGNFGNSSADHGAYEGVTGFANLSGGIKQAKNTLVVGATDKFHEVSTRSSRGPTYDGRLKPEIVAYGSEGTSEAAALVSGTSQLLYELIQREHNISSGSDLLKSILIASATDVGVEGPDYVSGFGRLNAFRSNQVAQNGQFYTDTLKQSTPVKKVVLTPPVNSSSIRIALTWNDREANAGDFRAIVNDLDLSVNYNGETIMPLVPNASPSEIAKMLPAISKRDSLNNTELVILDNYIGGDVEVLVNGFDLIDDIQPFAVSYFFEEQNAFSWISPNELKSLLAGSPFVLRYESSFESFGQLYQKENEGNWQLIGTLDAKGYNEMEVSSNAQIIQFKAVFGNDEFESDIFSVFNPVEVEKIYACDNNLLFTWTTAQQDAFNVYGISSETFERELIANAIEPEIAIDANNVDTSLGYLIVQPVVNGKESQAYRAYNFGEDGIGCYVRLFNATTNVNEVDLQLSLTTGTDLSGVKFVRSRGDRDTIIIASSTNLNELSFSASTTEVLSGFYSYWAILELENSPLGVSEIIVPSIDLSIIQPNSYSIFPNPLPQGEELYFLGEDNLSRIRLFDTKGNFVNTLYVDNALEFFDLKSTGSGLYLYQLVDTNNKIVKTGRLVIK